MGIEDKLTKTYNRDLINLEIEKEKERKAASKANIRNITGVNVKQKVEFFEPENQPTTFH